VLLVASVAALVAAIAALISARLTARLAVTRVALIPLEMATASASTAATAILALFGIFPVAAGAGRSGLRRGGGCTAKKPLHPSEEAARFLGRLGLGRKRGFRPARLIPSRTCLVAGIGRLGIPAVPLRAEDGPVVAAVIAWRTGEIGREVGGPTRLAGGLACGVAE
jgi:hypothetical protein